MKNIILSLAAVISFSAFAQQPKETIYEKKGPLVAATMFHENGTIAQKGTYLNGKLHGEWMMFNDQGDKLAHGSYALGVKTGKWLFWQENTLKEVDFINNKMAAITQWNNKGTVVLNK
ncbi:nicotinic acid mononucleotide adenyltransferase [Flavobacteriaceae bacterium]|nr:nicotinic acid mononucleotide adenyltransferase [Flavobacteriaceae bacterium]